MEQVVNPSDTHAVLLERELERRISRNPRYSMRGFASSLGISHSLLSMVLSRRRKVSSKLQKKIQEEIAPTVCKNIAPDLNRKISLDVFSVLSDWQYYALLSLLELPSSRLNPAWISKMLGISSAEASIAIARLKRLKLICKTKGRWRQSSRPLIVENTVSHRSTREHHRQILRKAEHSLENDPFETRDFSAVTFAMNSQSVDYARNEIRKFRRKLMKELEEMGEPDSVYELSVQIFPLTVGKRI